MAVSLWLEQASVDHFNSFFNTDKYYGTKISFNFLIISEHKLELMFISFKGLEK